MSLIYNILLVLLLISAFLEYSGNLGKNKSWFYTIIMIMLLTAGLAYGISPDWISYWKAFEFTAQSSFSDLDYISEQTSMEIGYVYLNKLISLLGIGYAGFVLITVTIMLILKSNTIYKYGSFPFLALLLYFILNYFFEEHVHVRQGLAAGISMFSIRYIIKRKFWKFLICIIIAFQFHKSVIVFFLAYWIVHIDLKILHIIGLVVFAIISQLTGLSTFLDSFMQYLPFGVDDKYSDYESDLGVTGALALGDIVKVLTVIAIVLYDKSAKEADEHYVVFRNLFITGIVLYFFFGKGIFGIRLPSYYTVYFVFVAPRLVKGANMSSIRQVVFGTLILYVVLLYFRLYQVQGHKAGFGRYSSILTTSEAPYSFFIK